MLFSRNKPDWLYNILPAVYGVAGLAVIAAERNTLGLVSGGLLVLAAIAIVLSRWRYRRRLQEELLAAHGAAESPAGRRALRAAMIDQITPDPLGHADIDREHRDLAARCAALRHGAPDASADQAFQLAETVEAFAAHVSAEIEAMRRLGVARHETFVQADREALGRAEARLARCASGEIPPGTVADDVVDWLVVPHLKSPHPALPSLEAALQKLRAASS